MTKGECNIFILKQLLKQVGVMGEVAVKAIPSAILISFIAYLVVKVIRRRGHYAISRIMSAEILALTFYLVVLFESAILFRPMGKICIIDLVPFNTPGGWQYIMLYAVVNAVIFIPLGLLVPALWKRMRQLRCIVFIGFLLSLFIEVSQLVLKCGVFQTEDIIMNIIGAGVGYWIWKNIKKK